MRYLSVLYEVANGIHRAGTASQRCRYQEVSIGQAWRAWLIWETRQCTPEIDEYSTAPYLELMELFSLK